MSHSQLCDSREVLAQETSPRRVTLCSSSSQILLSGAGSSELGCSPAGVSVSDGENKHCENTDGVDVTKPHALPGKQIGERFLTSTKYTFNPDSSVIPQR